MPLTPASRLGPYEIVAPLGAGGMGEVYRAKDPRLGREVALKVLPAEVAAHPERLARFEREARAVAGLNHPNIVTLYSVEDAGGVRFLTMELVEGQSLDRLVAPGGLPVPRVIDLGIALADALAAAHEKAIVHRDLKPANVMVTRDERVKVLDFGLAKAQSDPELDGTQAATVAAPISNAGQIVGTVPYMAPEQLRGDAVDARSDLFSLGILIYELASGRRPFGGHSHAEVGSAILRDDPPSLTRLRIDLPGELAHIVERCLQKNPRERFQTALDVANELRSVRRTLGPGAPGPRRASGGSASIAVLPFVNRSASADDEYFSDGLADELLGVLSKIKGLRVTARTSSFQFKGSKEDVPTIGRKLDVATLLEGSVRKAGNRIRVSVQLVNVADSSHLWSETYDRTLEDVFAVQDDIAQSVVKELRRTLLGGEADSQASGEAKADVAQAARGRSTDPAAHQLYLLAGHLIERFTREDTARAIEYLKQALERDPKFALAWAQLSKAHSSQGNKGWVAAGEAVARARNAAEQALALEPELAEAHVSLGLILNNFDWNWRAADASLARALALAPRSGTVLRVAGSVAASQGRIEEAIQLYRRALEHDPLSATCYFNLGITLSAADRHVEAEAAYRKSLDLDPPRGLTHAMLSEALLAQGRHEEALAEALREPLEIFRLWILVGVHHGLGQRTESDSALRELIEKHPAEAAYQIAEAFAMRGEVDQSFEWLDRAYANRDAGIAEMKARPNLRSLHGDPRWRALMEKLGLGD